jgi:hypothetical protein
LRQGFKPLPDCGLDDNLNATGFKPLPDCWFDDNLNATTLTWILFNCFPAKKLQKNR